MNRQTISLKIYGLFVLSVLFLAGLGWLNYRFAAQEQGGHTFIAYWLGTRALVIDGVSPYSEAVTKDIQQALSERSVPPFSRVTFPLYSMLLFLPFALFTDGILARILWMIALEIFLILFAVACVRLNRWRLRTWSLILYALFVLTWFHGLIAIYDGDMVVLAALLLAWVLIAVRNGQDELAGGLLALSTIQPLAVLLPMVFILWWAGSQKRWKLVVWFLGTVFLLVLGSMFFMQDWLIENIRAVFASLEPLYIMTPGAAFAYWWPGVGSRLGWVLTALLGIVLLVEWWMAIRAKEFRWFLWTASLTLVFEQLIGIRTQPVNYIILLIPLTLVFAVWDERWRGGMHQYRAVIATVASILLLDLGIWAIYWNFDRQGLALHQMPVLLFPIPLFLTITLYWVRWWAIRPQRLYVEALREGEITG